MRIRRYLFIAFPVFTLFFYSCTKIDAPYATINNSNIKDTVYNWNGIQAIKRVLLEDYTGHKCVNCPEASVIAKNLEETYSGKLIVLAVHEGIFAVPASTGDFTADYRSVASEKWATDFGIVSNPNGLINRKEFNGNKVLGKDFWGDAVAQIINLAPDAQMLINNSYDNTSGIVNTTVLTRFLNPLSGSYKITVCIVQDSLISPQKNNNPAVGPTPIWYNYVFNDVLRGSLNGSDGEVLTESVNTGITYLGRFNTTLNPAWVAKNCWILAFVYNATTKEIVQAEKKRVI